jgi:hypothetical protein
MPFPAWVGGWWVGGGWVGVGGWKANLVIDFGYSLALAKPNNSAIILFSIAVHCLSMKYFKYSAISIVYILIKNYIF